MNGWAILLIAYFALNAILYVAFIGKTITYTISTAVVSLFMYAGLIWLVFKAVAS